ncbi:hypothetical protein B0H13DRAFT_2335021 [Mycena leptocephala]|nr:hypothetical protein B0H13DRAFT_2335021 [Mycena leptocephala]
MNPSLHLMIAMPRPTLFRVITVLSNSPLLPMIFLKDEYFGVWIHGIDERDLKFCLGHARVPCFLIHELLSQEAPSKLSMEDFVQGTAVASLLDPWGSESDRVALRLNGGIHTLHDASFPLPGIAFRPPADRLLSGGQNQWGPPVLHGRQTRSESPGGVYIPGSDEEEGLLDESRATVATGSEWSTAPREMILGTEVTVPFRIPSRWTEC